MDNRKDFSSNYSTSAYDPQFYEFNVVAPRKDDGEEVLQCPYDPSHMILRSRMNRHMMKCVKNYRGPPLKRCPFNSMHMIEPKDFAMHMHICEDYVKNKKWDDFTKHRVA